MLVPKVELATKIVSTQGRIGYKNRCSLQFIKRKLISESCLKLVLPLNKANSFFSTLWNLRKSIDLINTH